MTLLELADWALSRARDEAHTITDPSKADNHEWMRCAGKSEAFTEVVQRMPIRHPRAAASAYQKERLIP